MADRPEPPLPTVAGLQQRSGLVPADARVLLAHVLGVDRAWLVAHARDPVPRDAEAAFRALAARRHAGHPVAYLVGRREFHGLDLAVGPAVLIPRPETETLVEVLLEALPAARALRVLDLGTGSGAIALAVARARPDAEVTASDASDAALAVAEANARRLAIANVRFVRSDWYASLPPAATFDAIASNPPYIAAGDPHLGEGDLRFEPRSALTPGGDGLDALRTIVAGAVARLVPGGVLAVEHGYDQAEAVARLFEAAGFGPPTSRRDLAGIPRVAMARHRLPSAR